MTLQSQAHYPRAQGWVLGRSAYRFVPLQCDWLCYRANRPRAALCLSQEIQHRLPHPRLDESRRLLQRNSGELHRTAQDSPAVAYEVGEKEMTAVKQSSLGFWGRWIVGARTNDGRCDPRGVLLM